MSVFDRISSMFGGLGRENTSPAAAPPIDKNLAAAALMCQVLAADGSITADEERRMSAVLESHYGLSSQEARDLGASARELQREAVDFYAFTSVLRREMNDDERTLLVEDLWEMVFADGEIHEFEDNVVWRVAELLGVQTRDRMLMKQRVQARINGKF